MNAANIVGLFCMVVVSLIYIWIVWAGVWFVWTWTEEYFGENRIFLALTRFVIYTVAVVAVFLKFWMFWAFGAVAAYLIPYLLLGGQIGPAVVH